MRDDIFGAAKPTSDNSYSKVFDFWIHSRRPAKLLDIGCGGGQFVTRAAVSGLEVYGMDADFRMVKATRERSAGIDDVCKRILHGVIGQELPDCWPSFDYVTAFEVLEHTTDPMKALAWIRSILSPGGWVVGSVPDSEKMKIVAEGLMKDFPETPEALVDLNRHRNAFEQETFEDLLAASAFEGVEVEQRTDKNKRRLVFRGQRARI